MQERATTHPNNIHTRPGFTPEERRVLLPAPYMPLSYDINFPTFATPWNVCDVSCLAIIPEGITIDEAGQQIPGTPRREGVRVLAVGQDDAYGIYRAEAMGRLAQRMPGINNGEAFLHSYTDFLVPSGDDEVEKIQVNWAGPMVEYIQQKYSLPNTPIYDPRSKSTFGEMAVLLDNMTREGWRNTIYVTDSFQLPRQELAFLALTFYNGRPTEWAKDRAENSLFMIANHPGWNFFADKYNTAAIRDFIRAIPNEQKKQSLFRTLRFIEAISHDPQSFFTTSTEELIAISKVLMFNLIRKSSGNSWFVDVTNHHKLKHLGNQDATLTPLLVEHVFQLPDAVSNNSPFDEPQYNRNLLDFATLESSISTQIKVLGDLQGIGHTMMGAYYADAGFRDSVVSEFLQTKRRRKIQY